MNYERITLNTLSQISFDELNECLKILGMTILGECHLEPEEAQQFTNSNDALAGLVVASHGQDMWRVFRNSGFLEDQLPNPLDRWTKSQLEEIASKTGTGLALPFDRPFPPFQNWAMRAAGLARSPLGILLHPRYGLWFGLRGVFFFKVNVENQAVNKLTHSGISGKNFCESCVDKPCLSHCPVNAFTEYGLNVDACFSHLKKTVSSSLQPDCLSRGCVARDACPVGIEHKYCDEQLRFHMNSYFGSNLLPN